MKVGVIQRLPNFIIMGESSIRTIIKQRQQLEEQMVTAIDDSGTVRKRSKAMETMEILLIDWIKRSNEKIDLKKVKEKALELYYDIKENQKDKTEQELKETFKASNGWFQKFKRRTGLDRNQIDFEDWDFEVKDENVNPVEDDNLFEV